MEEPRPGYPPERFDHDRAVADGAPLQGGDMGAQRSVQADDVPGAFDLRLTGLRIELRHRLDMYRSRERTSAALQ
jgi:hypothetical protein